jgi:hypothetical protein
LYLNRLPTGVKQRSRPLVVEHTLPRVLSWIRQARMPVLPVESVIIQRKSSNPTQIRVTCCLYGEYQITNLRDIPHQSREGTAVTAISNPNVSSRNPLAYWGDVSYWIPLSYTLFYAVVQEEKRFFNRIFQKPAYIPPNPQILTLFPRPIVR